MRLEYEPIFEDQLALDRARQRVWHKVPAIVLFGIFGLLCYGVGISGYVSGTAAGWWVLPAVFTAIACAAPTLTRLERRRAWRKAVGPFPTRVLVAIADEGLLITGGAEQTFLEWRAFTHYRETKELFLLYQGPAFMRFFPKRVFGGKEDVEWFRKVLSEKVVRTKYVVETPAFPVVPVGSDSAAGRLAD